MYGVHNNRCPSYISDVVQYTKTASTHGRLRSAETTGYVLPRLRTKFADCWARFLLHRSGRVEPPARVNPQNIIPSSLRTTTQIISYSVTFLLRDAAHKVAYADRGYATVCRLYVCPSVTFRYRDHIGWNTLM